MVKLPSLATFSCLVNINEDSAYVLRDFTILFSASFELKDIVGFIVFQEWCLLGCYAVWLL
jgi:hypothetical protein